MKRGILVYNPVSGEKIIPSKLDYIIESFQSENIFLQPLRTEKEDFEKRLIFIIKDRGYDFIIISGGDGTVNLVVNILLKNEIDIPIGIFPYGTCNDFARCLDIGDSLKDMIDNIIKENIKKIDVGLINGNKYILNTYAGGMFAGISFDTDKELKENFGPFAYYLKAAAEMINFKTFKLKVTYDEGIIEEDTILFMILNGKHVAGLSNIAKDADMSDGLMDLIIVKNCEQIDMTVLFFKFITSELINDKNVRVIKTRKCILESDREITLSIDGEKGESLPVEIVFLNKRLKVYQQREC